VKPRHGVLLALGVSLCLVAACAVVEPPPGGPTDTTPPHLAFMDPDSGATGVGELKTIRLTFSEKMDRTSAVTWLHFFPDQRIRQTKWHGATEAEVILEYPLPADTVIVIELAADMRDAHKVKNPGSRRFPIATGDSIPAGMINGVLIMADSAVTNGVVELYEIPPDTLEYFQMPIIRRTVTDATGAYRFDWLPVPGGPWLARAYADPDNNLRPGERESQRLLPDTLSLTGEFPQVSSGVTTMFSWDAPGRVLVAPFATPALGDELLVWSLAMAAEDTGWVPVTEDGKRNPISRLVPTLGGTIEGVKSGGARLIFFADVNGDSIFGGVPDSLLIALPDSLRTAAPDSGTGVPWFLEPWFMVEDVTVEPGLDGELEMPEFDFTYTPWTQPAPAPSLPDSLEESE
jgi:hypothetical protein